MPTRTSGSAWRERWEPSEFTDHAQAELTDIVYVEVPATGVKLEQKQTAALSNLKAAQ